MENPKYRPVVKKRGMKNKPRSRLFRIIRGAFITFSATKGSEASAALAYYTLLSIFPLLLVIVFISSSLVDQVLVEHELTNFFTQFFPFSQDFIQVNIRQIFESRGALSAISLLSLIWSSTGVFSTLLGNINSAWPAAAPQSFIKLKLTSVGIIFLLTFVMILSSFSFTIKNILTSMGIPLDTETIGAFLSSTWTVRIITITIDMVVLFLLYYRVPQIHVNAKSALMGAGISTLLAQVVTIGFSAYMVAGIQRYEIIYGSLGKIIALLAWAYFSGYIILFGAHLTSSLDRNGS